MGKISFFAYGPLVDPELAEKIAREWGLEAPRLDPRATVEALDVDIVYDRPSKRWGGKAGALADRKGRSVFGRLYEVPTAEWDRVRRLEGADVESAVERAVTVRLPNGSKAEARAFGVAPGKRGKKGTEVSERYARLVADAADSAGLPEAYRVRVRAEAMILERVQGAAKQAKSQSK